MSEADSGTRQTSKLEVGPLWIERARSSEPLAEPIHLPIARRTSIIVQMKPFRRHKLWRSQVLVYEGAHKPGGVSITNMEEEWKCHHLSAFDNFRMQIDHDQLDELAAQGGAGRGFSLRNPGGAVDRTMQLLVNAVYPALHCENNFNRLYIEHVTSAMMVHIISVYGGGLRRGRYAPTLSPRHERLALDYMRHHVAANISVRDIASECGISAGHFTKAFSESTGLTPHQWILRSRVELAKELLAKDMAIAAIAASCGFADQSHFSRVFKKMTGFPPAKWRKQ